MGRWCVLLLAAAASAAEGDAGVGDPGAKTPVAAPAHALGDADWFRTRVAAITDEELLNALDLERTDLEAVRTRRATPTAALEAKEVWVELGTDSDTPPDGEASDDTFPRRFRLHSIPFALRAKALEGAISSEQIYRGS